MTLREGNLEAPTRHPIDWKSPDYYDEAKALAEMERVFDICHGCRRCVSLCTVVPDPVRPGRRDRTTARCDGVDKKDYWKVVDQCYLCDLCYMTKCPYVPPHPWNVDFPHLMLRAKAIKFRKGEVGGGEKLLASTDVHGKLAGIPVVVQVVNAANRTRPVRKVLDERARRPPGRLAAAAGDRSASAAPRAKSTATRRSSTASARPGKVAVFSTCYVNYNEPGIGHDLLALLEHNEIPYEIVEKESCCGMPKLELGDLEGVAQAQGGEHPGAGALRARGLRDPHARSRPAR